MNPTVNSELFQHYLESTNIPADLLHEYFSQLPLHHQMHSKQLLYLANRYQLDILAGEILLTDYDDGHTQVHISVDGWTQLIHRHEQFCGLQFQEASTLEEGVPVWMMCTIYRKDLVLPIMVKEYFSEIKTSERIWQTMPRRMLRHRTLQQCARLAFGFSGSELICPKSPSDLKLDEADAQRTKTAIKPSRTHALKKVLQDQTMTQSEAINVLTPNNSTIGTADFGPAPSGS